MKHFECEYMGQIIAHFPGRKHNHYSEQIYMNLFFFSAWIQPFLKKRETMPLFSGKFFEHAHLKGIIFSDNTFYCYIAKSRFPRPLYISK